jgi:hypothetical protein
MPGEELWGVQEEKESVKNVKRVKNVKNVKIGFMVVEDWLGDGQFIKTGFSRWPSVDLCVTLCQFFPS